ncbi:helix-turn-helix domain-containing protein [Acidocella sp.]|uniref:helix-turn-helix domain-containing protein n=1 Tax=Acidocella sp. TaxID=50710 RepID=UPI00260BF31A|nr:helix-turn-helix domain-containing protein [Acidocella sp.]
MNHDPAGQGAQASAAPGAALLAFEQWCEALNRDYALGCARPRGIAFASGISMGEVGGLRVADVSMSPQTLRPHCRQRAEEDVLMVKMIAEGEAVFERDGEQRRLGAGGLIIVDPAQPFQEHVPAHARLLVVNAPKAALRERGYRYRLNRWLAPDITSPDVRLVQDMIRLIAAHGPALNPEMRTRLGCQLLDLMDVILREDDSAATAATRLRVKHYIAQNLHDATLDAARIAAAVNLSVGHLHKLFAGEDMSLMRFVWNRRLDAAREMLGAPRWRALRIEAIAWRCGFISPAHFSRLFKARFGVSPRALRPAS